MLKDNLKNYLFISYNDNTVRMHFSDTLKERLSFYGHALPVTDFDISSDDYVVATVSSDKSLRIWDSEFGNCRKIITRAHGNAIHCIAIVKNTHYALTGGNLPSINFWDLDTFELI